MFGRQNQEESSFHALLEWIREGRTAVECTGADGAARALLISRLHAALNHPWVVIAPSPKDAEKFLGDLRFLGNTGPGRVHHFPAYSILPFKYLSYPNEIASDRIRILYQLITADRASLMVTSVDAVLQKLIPKRVLNRFAELLMPNEEFELEALTQKLISGGYVRTMMVEEPGEFSVRGGILDLFSPLYDAPLRVEFYGDRVDSLRFFSSETQRTLRSVHEAVILPARESIIVPEHRDEVIGRIRLQASRLGLPVREVRKLVERVKNEGAFPGTESLTPMIYENPDSLFDYLPEATRYVLLDPDRLDASAQAFETQLAENYRAASVEKRICAEPGITHLTWSWVKEKLRDKKTLTFRFLDTGTVSSPEAHPPFKVGLSVSDNTGISETLKLRRDPEHLLSPLAEWIRDNRQSRLRTLLVCRSRFQGDRLISLLAPYGIPVKRIVGFDDGSSEKEGIHLSIGQVSNGFVWPEMSLALITEDEIFGERSRRRRGISRKQIRTDLLSLDELKADELVVHVDHGIGQYHGLVKLKLDGAVNDYLLILYKGGDKLYLPVDRINMVQKYVGVDGMVPVLARLGGKSWERIKESIKRSTEKIAGDLLKLYASRKVRNGLAFSKPDEYFGDFEAAFPHEETEDQIKAIDDVLMDMQHSNPMDRLICGDVGYGKTEVALRASFMAVYNGKQTALLVPTTVLAEQHYRTFTERFRNYPIRIACLSRFRTRREQSEIIGDLKNGKIDIVVGTHRLIQKDVAFKDLGLLIVDEEQRFGVRHKERLKQLRNTVDVLALTATPIPRTLHLSLTGIRDISVISTPPEHRRPIITHIAEFDDAIIQGAIRKELERKGQIFFVHNNIYSIEAVAVHLKRLVPEVRLEVAHGRMSEATLEKVMLRFINRETDMLVCTTIIESGLDIPSANTILVNRADKFGLAQMYQLRGRVGRADEQAYAYLFIPRGRSLTRDAEKRLKVLMEHSDLGSGFQMAMSDLKIRGGGTILGSAQSGHIAAVGYDMFLHLMENAVTALKGEPVTEPLEPEISISLSSFIPESFIPDIDQRLSTYRRLARVTEIQEISDLKSEFQDRFGPLPAEVKNLLLKMILRVLSKKIGVKKLHMTGNQLILTFSEVHLKNPDSLVKMVRSDSKRFELAPDSVLKVVLSAPGPWRALAEAKNILKDILQHVNCRNI